MGLRDMLPLLSNSFTSLYFADIVVDIFLNRLHSRIAFSGKLDAYLIKLSRW